MRNHVDLAAGHFEDFLQELRRELAHDNEAIGKLCDLLHDHELVRIRLAQNRVQRGHHRHFQAAQQMQNVASGRTAEDSILVLQAHHVDIVEVQEFSRILIGLHIVLGERPSHSLGIVISLFSVVYWQRQQSSGSVLGGYGRTEVGGERSNSTLPRKIISDHRDSARQRRSWLRSWTSRRNRLFRGALGDDFQRSVRKHGDWQ